jgi:hypothetical protein
MMPTVEIQKLTCYRTTDGEMYSTLDEAREEQQLLIREAQEAQLNAMLRQWGQRLTGAGVLVGGWEEILKILKTSPTPPVTMSVDSQGLWWPSETVASDVCAEFVDTVTLTATEYKLYRWITRQADDVSSDARLRLSRAIIQHQDEIDAICTYDAEIKVVDDEP